MSTLIRNILVVILGIVVGSIVNMSIISISGSIIPPPAGVDLSDMESLKASMHLFGPKNFIFPYLAHALGTLVGAFLVAKFAVSKNFYLALFIGFFFLIGGVVSIMMLPSPIWFSALDSLTAYIPMAWIGARLAGIKR
uniref:hypothetical protein n=1 Tax=Fulvivirga sp. TaxID=1931237 RepID=UPI00404B8A9C